MKKKLSIIIPVYNVEKYLKQCLDSIIYQQLDNYEVIMVDDGSLDNSGKICDNYAKENLNFKVVHQNNKGLSGARNTGIKASCGEFLMFVDSDDFINKNINLKEIINDIKKDVTQYKWIYYYDQQEKYRYFKNMKEYTDSNIGQLLYNKAVDGSFSVSACDKIVKRDVIINNNIMFKEGIYSEDMDWTFRLYQSINSYSILNKDIYVYRQARKDSITSKIKNKNILDLYDIIKNWYEYNYKNEKIKEAYLNYLAYHYIILLTLINKKNCSKEQKEKIYELDGILEYSNNKKVKLSKKIFKYFGKWLGIRVLKTYIFLKDLGIVKI